MKSRRLKNYGLWVSIFALIGMIIQDLGVLNITTVQFETYTQSILTILVLLGIVNDPTTGKWYKDKQ